MGGHNGYGATRGGRLPKGKPLNVRASMSFVTAYGLGMEVRRLSAELEMTPTDILARMRKDGVVDCNDEAAAFVIEIAEGGAFKAPMTPK